MTRKTEKPLVRIVDDDPDQLASLEIMLSAEGWDVACYERASDFFAEDTPSRPGCLILDVRMPEISGLEMQEELNRREYPLPEARRRAAPADLGCDDRAGGLRSARHAARFGRLEA